MQSVEEAIKTDHLLSKEDFLRIARPTDSDTHAAYEEYVRQHQRAFLIRFNSLHGADPWLHSLYINSSNQSISSSQTTIRERLEWFIQHVLRSSPSLDFLRHEDVIARGKRDGRMVQLAPEDFSKIDPAVTLPLSFDKRQLYVNNIPPNADPVELMDTIRQSVPHADGIVLSNPVPSKGFTRSGWLSLDSHHDGENSGGSNCSGEVRLLDGMAVSGSSLSFYPKDTSKRIKLVSNRFSSTEERIKKDLWISLELITSMNVARGIAFDLSEFHEVPDLTARLDLQIMFLRVVHWVCYYSAYEAACPEELVRHCGDVVLRDSLDGAAAVDIHQDDLCLFDKKIQLLIDRGYRSLGLRPVRLEEQLEQRHVQKIEDHKFKCVECGKLFKGPEFVVKHLGLKHEELVSREKEGLELLNKIIELPHFLLIPNSMIVRSDHYSHHHGHHQNRPFGRLQQPNGHPRPAGTQRAGEGRMRPPRRPYVDLDAPNAGNNPSEIAYDL